MKYLSVILLSLIVSGCPQYIDYEKPHLDIPNIQMGQMETINKENLIQTVSNNIKKMQVYIINQDKIIKAYKDYFEEK